MWVTHLSVGKPGVGTFYVQKMFAAPEVDHYHQPVAVAVAETFEQARAASSLIRVRYERSDGRYDLDAQAEHAPVPPEGEFGGPNEKTVGDFAKAFAAAPVKIHETYVVPDQAHCMMEPHATIARWDGDRVTCWTSIQQMNRGTLVGNRPNLALYRRRIRREGHGPGGPRPRGDRGPRQRDDPPPQDDRRQSFGAAGRSGRERSRLGRGEMTFERLANEYQQRTFGAHFAEVAVDAYAGVVRVRRMIAVCAAGRILNAKTARSQVIGGMTLGLGAALVEEMAVDSRFGFFVNHDLAGYEVPVYLNVPHSDAFFIDEVDPTISPVKAKGVGKLGLTGVAPAIANAVYNATGVRVREYPITLEKHLAGLPAIP